MRGRIVVGSLALIAAIIAGPAEGAAMSAAAGAPAWLNISESTFPARVTGLNFPEYQLVDESHTVTWGDWTVGMSALRPATASLISSCASHPPGEHAACAIAIDHLRCQSRGTIESDCTMFLEYDDWIDQYDCHLSVSGHDLAMRYCPEVQFLIAGARIGPSSFHRTPAASSSARRWITIHNGESEPLEAVYVEYDCCLAKLLDADFGDRPVPPGQSRKLALPLSLIGTVSTNDPTVFDRDQIDLTNQCMVKNMSFHLQKASENMGAVNLCKTTVINVKWPLVSL